MLKRKGIVAPTFLIVLFIGTLLFALYLINSKKISFFNFASQLTANVSGGPTNPNENKIKTLLVIYDPVLKTQNNLKLHEYYHWNDPKTLTTQLINDFKTMSHGNATYQIVGTIEQNNWLPHQNGLRYTESDYFNVYSSGKWDKGDADWLVFLAENDIVNWVNSGKVDEVWLWAPPEGGYPESTMFGNGAFSINGGPDGGANTKAFALMDFNYERGMAEALESYGHRTESIMRRVYGSWNVFGPDAKILHPWDAFTALDQYLPGKGGLGNAHNAFNAESGTDYNRYSQRMLPTSADDWSNFPNFTGASTVKNCTAWNCDAYQYLKWWYTHMPYMSGIKDSYLNNWWKYITNVEEYKEKFRFQNLTASPSYDYTDDPINQWQCSAVNGTCDVFDETTQKISGGKSIKYTTDSGFDTQVSYSTPSGTLNLAGQKYLVFSVFAVNNNGNPIFESNSPTVYLKDKAGNSIKYEPGSSTALDQAVGKWTQMIIPLDGDSIWKKTVTGNISLNDVTTIEIHADTWGYGFNLYFDQLGFTSSLTDIPDTTPPYVNITYPANNALIPQIATASAEATDSSKISRVDFFIDGKYVDTDAITPFTYDINPATIISGTHTLVARAFDIFGNAADSQISFASSKTTSTNKPPVAMFTAKPLSGRSPLQVFFTSTSSDPEGKPLTYSWNFGDASQTNISTLEKPTHTFFLNRSKPTDPKTKTFTVSLTVRDPEGKTSTYSLPINVTANNNPTVTFSKTKIARAQTDKDGGKVIFVGRATDTDNDPMTYLWDFGDGGTSTLLNPPAAHLYKKNGTYKVTLTVSDNHAGKTIVEKSVVIP